MIKPKNNAQLKKMIVDGVINCNGKDLICDFSIDVEADIINAGDINAKNIKAWNIDALDIKAWNINASNITAWDINAGNITAEDINVCDIDAGNINAGNITARNITYYALCCAYYNIKCSSIVGRRTNHKHFCLDGKITIRK